MVIGAALLFESILALNECIGSLIVVKKKGDDIPICSPAWFCLTSSVWIALHTTPAWAGGAFEDTRIPS
jgi:hypothetical protein